MWDSVYLSIIVMNLCEEHLHIRDVSSGNLKKQDIIWQPPIQKAEEKLSHLILSFLRNVFICAFIIFNLFQSKLNLCLFRTTLNGCALF